MRTTTTIILAPLALACFGSGPVDDPPPGKPEPRPAAADKTAELVESQLKLARRALQLIDGSRRLGAPLAIPSQETVVWSREVLQARIFLSLRAGEPKTQDVEVYLNQAKG